MWSFSKQQFSAGGGATSRRWSVLELEFATAMRKSGREVAEGSFYRGALRREAQGVLNPSLTRFDPLMEGFVWIHNNGIEIFVRFRLGINPPEICGCRVGNENDLRGGCLQVQHGAVRSVATPAWIGRAMAQ
jgi:hypothetical protein